MRSRLFDIPAWVLLGVVLLAPGALADSQKKRGRASARPQHAAQAAEWLAVQVALDRAGFSPGEIDGRGGMNTTQALKGFQQARSLTPTGRVDDATIAALGDAFHVPTTPYLVTDEDMAGPFVTGPLPRDMMELAKLDALGYTSPLEMLAERFHAQPALVTHLNGGAPIAAGQTITVPNVEPFRPPAPGKAPVPTFAANSARVSVSEATKTVRVEANGSIVFQAPVSFGSEQDPLPKGEWGITGTAVMPVFQYNPDLFWDADPSHAKAKVAPGPNNPVGVVWIDLEKEHLGFHGTPEPSTIGRAQSHGCLRLTNWDAMRLAGLVGRGARVMLQ